MFCFGGDLQDRIRDVDLHAKPQASTNTLLSHFVALLGNLWLARVVSANAEARPASYGAAPTPTPVPMPAR